MLPGAEIAHYRIVSRLGAGGMGEVFLARDARLDRDVALKILPPGMAAEPERMARFLVEARAAAALSHPNIAHIYETGESGGVAYLAMEYIDGSTLAALLQTGPLPLTRLIETGISVADALDEAHSKGITHRDIKPANIMVTARGQVKVLDFGLAKMPARVNGGPLSETDPRTAPLTAAGAVVGTAHYMSPEQALGRAVDHRTDIFSLGAVLYEMATARRAFPGGSTPAVFDRLLNHDPEPASAINHEVPAELDRVIAKALEKDPDLRYQTASDLRADLKRLRRDTESGRSSPATRPAEPPKRLSRRKWASLAALVAAAGAAGWFAWSAWRPAPPAVLQSVPLTSYPGSETQPSFSPDGSQVAFSWNGGSETDWDIYVKVVEAGTPLRLTSTPTTDHSPAWSPDGRHIAFLRQSETGSAFFLVPPLGGLERKLTDASPHRTGLETPYVAWSPDGARLAISDKYAPDNPMSIFLLDPNSGERKQLTFPPPKALGDSAPCFSPDGSSLAFIRTFSLAVTDIFVVPVAGGEPRRITNDGRRIFGMVWNRADNRIIFSSSRAGSARLWRIAPNGSGLERIIGVGENASFVTTSPRGDRLAYTRSQIDTNIWRYPLPGAAGDPDPLRLFPSNRQETGARYSPDGRRIAFSSNRTGSQEIWIGDSEGVNAQPLTAFGGPATGSPSWSPDGRTIAFDSRPDGNPDIYLIPAEGGAARRFTTDASAEVVPTFSRDGATVYFASNRSGSFQIWKKPSGSGDAVQVTRDGGFRAIESRDGKWLYFAKSPAGPGLWRMPLEGGVEEPVLETLAGGFWGYWELGRNGVYYVDRKEVEGEGVKYSLRLLPVAARPDTLVMPLPRRPYNAGLSLSPEGTHFLYTQVDQSDTDIMLVNHFR